MTSTESTCRDWRALKSAALLDGETVYEMWAEAIPCPKTWEELHALERGPWVALADKLTSMEEGSR